MIRKNRIGYLLNWEIPINSCGKGLRLCHTNVVINDHYKVGDFASFSGNNCIGRVDDKYPIIGNDVTFGYGAIVIGDSKLGDNIVIGANATVCKSFESNSILVGSPARIIRRRLGN